VIKSLDGNGYMLATVTSEKLDFQFYEVKVDAKNVISKTLFDECSVDLSGSNIGKLALQ
jgi:hypothetical protein